MIGGRADASSATATDPLDRFVHAQADSHATALAEIRAGRKQTHWIWYVFPQLRGLGSSPAAHLYGLSGLEEAKHYLAHPLLGARLRACTTAMLATEATRADAVLGALDAMKFRSSMTLFAQAAPAPSPFNDALDRFFDGEPDVRTLELLALDSRPRPQHAQRLTGDHT